MEQAQQFTYTANRKAFDSAISTIMLILLFEGGVVITLILLFVQNLPLKLLLVALQVGLIALVLWIMRAPAQTSHAVDATNLYLHYGRFFRGAVPLAAIASAKPVSERLQPMQATSVEYRDRKKQIVALFSEDGQVQIDLNQMMSFPIGPSKRAAARSLLINVDQRDEFLARLQPEQAEAPARPAEQRPAPVAIAVGTSPAPSVQPRPAAAPPAAVSVQREQAATGTAAIRTEGLSRLFQDFKAVDNLNLTIQPGEVYGFLGTNGAGKTTSIKMLVHLLEPSAGRVLLQGHDLWANPTAAKASLGYVADTALLYERLTGREFLHFMAQMRGIPQDVATQRIEHYLEQFELSDRANRLCGSYSFGMKRKLSLAAALLHQPSVLILDEPLNGLDPISARRIKDLFLELASAGTAILLSTHDLATAENVCDRVGIVHQGKLRAEGSAGELRQITESPDLEAVFLSLTRGTEEVA